MRNKPYWLIGVLGLFVSSCGGAEFDSPRQSYDSSYPIDLKIAKEAPVELDKALLEAVRSEDSKRVQLLLDAGANVNSRDESGFTILANALAEFESELIGELLTRGAVINSSVLPETLEEESEPNDTTLDEKLVQAINEANWEAARGFIGAGANVNAMDQDGFTVLAMTLAGLKVNLIDLLLSYGAHV